MASTCSKHEENQRLKDADALFKLKRFDSAIKEARKAKKHDENLPVVDNYIAAYKIHKAMSSKENWYVVLEIPVCCNFSIVKTKFKKLALMVHPDKNPSLAAEDAFKHINEAWELLSDPAKKTHYDKSLMPNTKTAAAKGRYAAAASAAAQERYTAYAGAAFSPAKERYAAYHAAKAARTAAKKAAKKDAARKAAEEAAARRAAKAAAAKARKIVKDAAELEAALAAARRRRIAAKLAAESRKARRAAKEAAVDPPPPRSACNPHREPMSEVEYGIHLILKYTPNYMERKSSVW